MEAFDIGGLSINMNKTEYLVVGNSGRDIILPQGTIKSVRNFKYLGSIIQESGSCEADVDHRVQQARRAIKMLNGVLWSRSISKQMKKRILQTIVESILTYGAEGWALVERQKCKIQATEMEGIRRAARVSRLERRRNEDVRHMMDMEESVMERIEKRTLQWYGHVKRMKEERWPKIILEWSPRGRRKRARPRKTWKAGVMQMMKDRHMQEEDWRDRERWRKGIQGNR